MLVVSENILQFVEGSKLYKTNKILDTDHRRYVIDVNFSEYFEEEFSNWDNINRLILDPGKRTHRERFEELIEEILDTMNIENELERMRRGHASKQELEMLDRDMTYTMNKAWKKIEGPRRGIPYLKEKAKRYAVL